MGNFFGVAVVIAVILVSTTALDIFLLYTLTAAKIFFTADETTLIMQYLL